MARAKASGHKTELLRLLQGSHVQYATNDVSELTERELVKKLRACGGAHQPTGFDFGKGDVGEGGEDAPAAPRPPPANPADATTYQVSKGAAAPTPPAVPSGPFVATPIGPPASVVAPSVAPPAQLVGPAAPEATTMMPPPPPPEGGDCAILLVTGLPSTSVIEGEQKTLVNIFKGKKIAFETVDGLDPKMKDRRTELFAISDLRGRYPQVFLRKGGQVTFVGDFEKVNSLNDCDELPAEVIEANPTIETLSKAFQALL